MSGSARWKLTDATGTSRTSGTSHHPTRENNEITYKEVS
jgi:hypothetical protein